MMIRPSVKTPSTSRSSRRIFFALWRTLAKLGFTDWSDPGFEDVVQMDDADGLGAARLEHKQRSDRPRQVFFHLRQRLGGEDILFDGARLTGHDFAGLFVKDTVPMSLQTAAQISVGENTD